MMSCATFSATNITPPFKFAFVVLGITLASATLKPRIPRTLIQKQKFYFYANYVTQISLYLSLESTTANGSVSEPIEQVPTICSHE